jgi:hypothetical protein
MTLLNKSVYYKGEAIRGHFEILVDQTDPAIPSINLLNANLEMILKLNKTDLDVDALAILTPGDGLEVIENTEVLYTVIYRIPGSTTAPITPLTEKDNFRTIFYEINITYDGDVDSDVLEIGTIKIRTDRIKEIYA